LSGLSQTKGSIFYDNKSQTASCTNLMQGIKRGIWQGGLIERENKRGSTCARCYLWWQPSWVLPPCKKPKQSAVPVRGRSFPKTTGGTRRHPCDAIATNNEKFDAQALNSTSSGFNASMTQLVKFAPPHNYLLFIGRPRFLQQISYDIIIA
jgi:hypothetical protein